MDESAIRFELELLELLDELHVDADHKDVIDVARSVFKESLRECFAPMIVACSRELVAARDEGASKNMADAAFYKLREMHNSRDRGIAQINAGDADDEFLKWRDNGTLIDRLRRTFKNMKYSFREETKYHPGINSTVRAMIREVMPTHRA